jgi:hypothetical protein
LICVITSLDFATSFSSFLGTRPDYGAEIGDFKRFPTPPGNRLKLSPNQIL